MSPDGKPRMNGRKTIGSTMIMIRCAWLCIDVDINQVDVSWLATYTAMSTGPQPSFVGSVMSTRPIHSRVEDGKFGKISFSKSRRTKKSEMKIGIWKTIGKQEADGLILFSL